MMSEAVVANDPYTNHPAAPAVVLIGASGFGLEVHWVCRRAGLAVIGFCDDAADKQSGTFDGLPLLGSMDAAAGAFGGGTNFHVAVGDNRARQRLAERALARGWVPVSVVDPSALVAPDAVIDPGA